MAVINSHRQAMKILDDAGVVMPFSKEGLEAMRDALKEQDAKAKEEQAKEESGEEKPVNKGGRPKKVENSENEGK